MSRVIPPWASGKMDVNKRPLFVCWEMTKACNLSCRHCRARAIKRPLPGELSLEEGKKLIDQMLDFGEPYPAMLFTGGDPLMRPDLMELIAYARDLGIYTAVAASVTDLLTREKMEQMRDLEVGVMSISIDGSDPDTHDNLRGVPGTWKRSMEVLQEANEVGLRIQINSTVMNSNLNQLADLFYLALKHKVAAWEVFFLVRTGRGAALENPTPDEVEDVMKFLVFAAGYGITVRTSEGPQYRRVLRESVNGTLTGGPLYNKLVQRLKELAGNPVREAPRHINSTGDGKGVMFVSYNGEINPSGFLQTNLGKYPEESIVDVYTKNQTFLDLRNPLSLKGKCGRCEYRGFCGGSRSRAQVETGDILESDPLCIYEPGIRAIH